MKRGSVYSSHLLEKQTAVFLSAIVFHNFGIIEKCRFLLYFDIRSLQKQNEIEGSMNVAGLNGCQHVRAAVFAAVAVLVKGNVVDGSIDASGKVEPDFDRTSGKQFDSYDVFFIHQYVLISMITKLILINLISMT